MTYTRKISLAAALIATFWIPASLFFFNAGWLTLGLLTPGAWAFDTLFLLPLLVPILSMLTRKKAIPRTDRWLQIAFYVCWVLIGFFIVNGGDTEDSVRSIFSSVVRASNRQALNMLSTYIEWGLVAVSLILLFVILARIIGERLSAKNTGAGSGWVLVRNLFVSGIVPGAFSTLAWYLLWSLGSGMQDQVALASSIILGVSMLATMVVAYFGLRRLGLSGAFGASVLGIALVALVEACIEPFWQGASPALGLGLIFVESILITSLSFVVVGLLTAKINQTIIKNVVLSLVGLILATISVMWQYNVTQHEINQIAAKAKAVAEAPIDFKLYELTYTPGNPPVFRRHFYPGDKSAELDIDYSNFGQKNSDIHNFTSYSVRETSKDNLPAVPLGPDCSPATALGTNPVCEFAGTTTAGAKVFFVKSQINNITVINPIIITLGNTHITIENGSYYVLTAPEAMKIAEGLREVTRESQTVVGSW